MKNYLKIDIVAAVDRLCRMSDDIILDPTKYSPELLKSRKKDKQLLRDVASIIQSFRVLAE